MDETCFVTGHRPGKLGGYGMMDRLVELGIAVLRKHDPGLIYTGMDPGWDQAIARACSITGTPFIAAVPFKEQEIAWPESAQREYRNLLKLASEIVYVSSVGYAAVTVQIRNQYMVNHCTFGFALWDGTSGGTCNCMK